MNNITVYGWYDSNELFYVGIGTKAEAVNLNNRPKLTTDCRKIAQVWNTFSIEAIYENLTWLRAIEIQRQMIICYGRRFNGTGTLTNETLGNDYELPVDVAAMPADIANSKHVTVRTPLCIFESINAAAKAYETKPSKIKKMIESSTQKDWQYLTF